MLPRVKIKATGSGLSRDGEILYRRLLRQLPATAEQHAGELGWPAKKMADCLENLLQMRLIRRSPDGVLRADDPRATLGRLVDLQESELDDHRQRLLDLRSSIEGFEIDYRRGLQLTGPRVPPWEPVTPAEADEMIEFLTRNSEGPLLRVSPRMRSTDGMIGQTMQALDRELLAGRAQRSIFGLDMLTDPDWLPAARDRAAHGDQQRYLDQIPLEFAIYGRAGVLIAERRLHEDGFLLVRPSMMIDAFTALFASLWRIAEPVRDERAAPQDIKILELLALGFKDEAIARHLGIGLRTVRRRLAKLMAEHGADNRFQLGLAVARHELLADDTTR